jgi:ATP-dependent DNA helicase DinG
MPKTTVNDATLIDLVKRTFAADGWLARHMGYAHRPQQAQMALAVAEAILKSENLGVDAPTGTGKTLAYLVPSLIIAVARSRKALVSAHTINLQQQIESKDLPFARSLFGKVSELREFADFRVCVAVGKGNYLCGNRLQIAYRSGGDLLVDAEGGELDRIRAWSLQTQTGLRQELNPAPNPAVWRMVNSDSQGCNRKTCNPTTCFFARAREAIGRAHLVIANHAWVCSTLMATGGPGAGPGVVFENDFYVSDEAHVLPDVATDHFGIKVSGADVLRLFHSVWSPMKSRGWPSHLAGRHVKQTIAELETKVTDQFKKAAEWLGDKQSQVLPRRQGTPSPLPGWVGEFQRMIADLVGCARDEGEANMVKDIVREAQAMEAKLAEVLNKQLENTAYWVELDGRDNQVHERLAFRSAPVDVSDALRSMIFQRKTAAILTSATLATGTDMKPFLGRVGGQGAIEVQVGSPFDLEKQMQFFVATDAPEAVAGRPCVSHMADWVQYCVNAVEGGSLVLFTNYGDMKAVAAKIETAFTSAGRLFLMQGRDGPRGAILERFRADGHAILFGCDSFWTGIDVPGAALSQVIVTRLPFASPVTPLAKARDAYIRRRGKNPFNEIALPDAIIKTRQGSGRLIRRTDDRGRLVWLDSRVLQKGYGRRFLDTMGVAPVRVAQAAREQAMPRFRCS